MSFTTEQVFTYSGAAASGRTFFHGRFADNVTRNSGGIVNIAGPIIVRSIILSYHSGQGQAASLSGNVITVNAATSGMVDVLSGQSLYYFAPGAQSGLVDAMSYLPRSLENVDYIARSGVATTNSGTRVLTLTIHYTNFVA